MKTQKNSSLTKKEEKKKRVIEHRLKYWEPFWYLFSVVFDYWIIESNRIIQYQEGLHFYESLLVNPTSSKTPEGLASLKKPNIYKLFTGCTPKYVKEFTITISRYFSPLLGITIKNYSLPITLCEKYSSFIYLPIFSTIRSYYFLSLAALYSTEQLLLMNFI